MTVASETNRSGPYNGNGLTTAFNYEFRIVNEDHLRVILADADGAETTLVIDADYVVSDVGEAAGGQVTLMVAPATGETITILRNVPFVQETDLENQGAYYAETIEDALDLAVMRDQQLVEMLNRAVLVPASEDDTGGALAAQLAIDITRIADSADNLDIVADNIGAVNTVAGSISDVQTVATNIAAVVAASGSVLDLLTASFVGDGATDDFTLPGDATSAANVLVWLDGVRQLPATDYTVAGTTLTFLAAPANGAAIDVLVISAVSMGDVAALKDAAELAAAAAEDAAANLNWTSVADVDALATLDFAQYPVAFPRAVPFVPSVWKSGDYSARIAANDPRYKASALDPTGATGAWERAGSAVNTWAPPKWPSVDGSVYAGPIAHVWHRTGGWGTYGLAMLQLSDDAELPTGQFSVSITGLASAKHMTGGTIFGGWTGANSPNSEQAGHIWTAGAVVGAEINAGNRFAELGLLSDLASSTRRTVGLQVVPTWTPSDGMGPPAGIYHGSFGIAVHKSVDGHKWHTGWITSVDAIATGGIGFKMRGGSVLGNAPSYGLYMDGYHTNGIVIAGNQTDAFAVIGTAVRGINLANATLTNAILMAAGQGISWGTNAARLATTAGSLSLSTGTADDDFAIYANSFASRLFAGDATGGVPRITFYGGLAPVAKQTVTGAKGGNAALTDLLAKLAALGLITDSTT